MTTIDKLKEIATTSERLTGEQRQYIETTSAKMGVVFVPNKTKCSDCYKDQAVILWRLLAEKAQAKDKMRKYLLRAGVDVIFKGQRINAAVLTDELATELIADGFDKGFFSRIPNDNEDNG